MIQIKNRDRLWSIRSNIFIRPNFGVLGHITGQKFLSAQKSAFSPTWWRAPPPFIFFDNGLAKKKFFFCLRYEHMYLENTPLKWCYFVIWLKMEKNPQLRFPKNGIFVKKIFGHFLLLFFSIFFQKLSKSKGH